MFAVQQNLCTPALSLSLFLPIALYFSVSHSKYVYFGQKNANAFSFNTICIDTRIFCSLFCVYIQYIFQYRMQTTAVSEALLMNTRTNPCIQANVIVSIPHICLKFTNLYPDWNVNDLYGWHPCRCCLF